MVDTHPGSLDHTTRAAHEPIPATILCCPIVGREFRVTLSCLIEYGKGSVAYEWLEPDDPMSMKYGMRRAIAKHWTGERDLIHIDHDMVFTWDSLRDLSNCPNDFCCCPSWYIDEWITASLGFSKFSAKLQRLVNIDDVLDAHDACASTKDMNGCYGDWWGFEYHLMEELKKFVPDACVHNPVLNDHSFFGLKGSEPVTMQDKMLALATQHAKDVDDGTYVAPVPSLAADIETPEGRAAMVKHLREKMGWSLPGEPK